MVASSRDLDDPSVSVIVPIRNERAFIAECLQALRDQVRLPSRYEILVVDGMSDDGTREIVELITKEDPRVRVIDNPNRIVSTALNLGITSSTGDIVVRVDGHTRVAHDFIAANIELMREHPEAWSVGGPIAHRGTTRFARGVAIAMSSRLGVGGASHRLEHFEGYAEGTAFPAFRREVFARIGYFDEALVRNQDDELNFRITEAGGKIFISPRVKHDYFVRGSLKGLARQYMQYAYWKVVVFRKHRKLIARRHLVPVVFVIGAPVCAVAGILVPPPMGWIALAPLAAYSGLLAASFASALVREGSVPVAASATVATAVMHVSYGLGTIFGILAPPGASRRVRRAMERISR